jgi:hypothetical protein
VCKIGWNRDGICDERGGVYLVGESWGVVIEIAGSVW